jgi:Protein kinase domain/AAA ATPase domain
MSAELIRWGRYELIRELGRGGMAEVWLARDPQTDRRWALKRLLVGRVDSRRDARATLFEGEYHALAQLRHPHIVRVDDYGVESGQAYYTMELLEGGDLVAYAPLEWRKLAAVVCDIASALALIHSRRFVHRDVTPRNVHFDERGELRLIDFGALAPMGVCREVVGTPPFVPPEALNAQPLDGRSDVFSLGALAYWALSRRQAFPARSLRELRDCWRSRPADLSYLVKDLPPAFAALIMSMLALDPAMRPASASEVVDRLCAIADLPKRDDVALGRAFLTTPKLVGRDQPLATVRRRLMQSRTGRGSALLVRGEPGMGRTRFLERCVLESKIAGALVLYCSASEADHGEFGLLQTLAEEWFDAAPEQALALAQQDASWLAHALPEVALRLGVSPVPEPDELRRRQKVHEALVHWFSENARRRHTVVAIDDVQAFDDASLAVLVNIASAAERLPLTLLLSLPTSDDRALTNTLRTIAETIEPLVLKPLDLQMFTDLLRSLFGDVAGTDTLSMHLHALCGGVPSACMAFAKHLVERGFIRHEQGGWSIPGNLSGLDLPNDVRALHERRFDLLGEDSRELAETLAFADRTLPIEHYTQLTSHRDSSRMHTAVQALLSAGILARSRFVYTFADAGLQALLRETAPRERARAAHLRILAVLEQIGAEAMERAWHLLQAGELDRATTLVLNEWRRIDEDPGVVEILKMPHLAETIEPLIAHCEREGRAPLDVFVLREFLMISMMWMRPGFSLDISRPLEGMLRHDVGLVYWDEVDGQTPAEKIGACLTRAFAAHQATPEDKRGLDPLAALQHLARYVLYGTQCATVVNRVETMRELVSLIEMVANVAPALELIEQLAHAALAGLTGSTEAGQAGLQAVLVRLTEPELGLPENHRQLFRLGVLYGLGQLRCKYLDPEVLVWADELETHVLQQTNAWRLRKMFYLHVPDYDNAERCDQRIAMLSLLQPREVNGVNTFIELLCAASVGDFQGVRRGITITRALVARYPEFEPLLQIGEGLHQLLTGNAELAVATLRECERVFTAGRDLLRLAVVQDFLALSLAELGRYSEARDMLVERMQRSDTWMGSTTSAAILALCQAGCGERDAALLTAAGALRALESYRLHGPYRVVALETIARTALKLGDAELFEHTAGALVELSSNKKCPPLRARLAALLKQGQTDLPLVAQDLLISTEMQLTNYQAMPLTAIAETLGRATGAAARARVAVSVLVEAARAEQGYLYRVDAPSKLQLFAASTESQPPHDLERHVAERVVWWSKAVDDYTTDLDVTPDPEAVEAYSGLFSAGEGLCFQLVLVRTAAADAPIAAVALQIAPGKAATIALEVIECLGRALAEAPDFTQAP